MTDSESEISNPNVFTFQNVNTTVSARGPNTNITNFSFRNQMTSTMCMPRNFERQRYAESVSDQRSIYYRRETSPMSIQSACDIRPRNFQHHFNGMGSQKSVYNGRSGSPMSMRSIDSSASVSAADIAFAFKNVKFNKYDLKVIKDAYHKLMKQRVRKRIEKRRNMRLFLKGSRRRSGDDSGEQGSDSSISSDDCRSVKTSYKENMSCSNSARMDFTDFRKTVRDSDMLKDCSDNFKQSTFKNMFSINTSNHHRSQNLNSTSIPKHNNPILTQQERFKNGFLLPSQRFNRSVASTVIPESSENHHKNTENCRQNGKIKNASNEKPVNNLESGSDEEIFSEVTVREKSIESQRKRSLESDDDSSLPNKKRSKLSSPVKSPIKKVPSKAKNNKVVNNNNENTNNFEFAMPTLPVRKSKPKVQEKVIAKSKQPLTGFVEPTPPKVATIAEPVKPAIVQEKPKDDVAPIEQAESTLPSDVSMRPSFIKRKLFTQKLDVAEKANLSSDGVNSPQNVYKALQKEKNKARKLVTSQSCLNREVQEDNNLLDLIHKIVPPDRINITNQTTMNQTKTDGNNSNKKDDDDRWDVTSVISMCNEHDVSDTFTDEEIFQNDTKKDTTKKNNVNNNCDLKAKTTKTVEKSQNQPRECRILVEKLQHNQVAKLQTPIVDQSTNSTNLNTTKSAAKISAKTFWDTDFESDAECQVPKVKKYAIPEKQAEENNEDESTKQVFKPPFAVPHSPVSKQKAQGLGTSRWLNKTKNDTILNNTTDSTRKLNISSLSVRSHRTSKKKKCCETSFQEIKSKSGNTNKNPTKSTPPSTEPIKNPEAKTQKNDQNKNVAKSKAKPESLNKTSTNTNTKAEVQNKVTSKTTKPKANKQNTSKSRSSSSTRKSPEQTKPKQDRQIRSPKNKITSQSPNGRPIRSCRTPSKNSSIENSRSSRQFDISPLNMMPNRATKRKNYLNETSIEDLSLTADVNPKHSTKKTKTNELPKKSGQSNVATEVKNNKNKTSAKVTNKPNTKNANKSLTPTLTRKSPKQSKAKVAKQIRSPKDKLKYQSPRIDRPIRSCRTPSQNRSIDNYKSTIKKR
ncbi:uncharacterized protein LOC142979998 [Anticarsia gemmatalis]|uniref:uncharacterized protein LOC142979998 n=1 Tax=Anticarsia gemmatalis TaxID=129554 RepID=UPI003F76DCE0